MKETLDQLGLDEISYFSNPTHLRDLIALMPGNIYWKNRQGYYLGCNNNNAKILGLKSPEEIIGKNIYQLLDKKYATIIDETDKKIMSEGNELVLEEDWVNIDGDPTTYLTRKIPLFGENQQVIGLLGISFDISCRKQMERELKEAKEFADQRAKNVRIYLKNILVSLPENFYWLDKESRILGCNENQAKLFGANRAREIIGKDIYECAQMAGWTREVADRIRKNDIEIMTTKQRKKMEETVYFNGKKRIFISYKNPLLDDNNEVIGVFGVSLDITEQKQLEEELLLAKEKAEHANQAKSEFIMNMSHDLRTPFSGILGFSKILQKKETDAEKKEILGYIVQSSERLLGLLNEILDLTKSSKIDFPVVAVKFNFFDILNNVIELMQAEIKYKKLNFKLNCMDDVPAWLIGDKSRLHRILLNLLGNAVKFTQHGYIAIHVLAVERSEQQVSLQIAVEDTGIGIAETDYQTIFERFSRLTSAYEGKYQGSGLGLYIVKKFVEEMAGKITVTSKINSGTTFTCILPFAIEKSASTQDNSHHLLSSLEIRQKITQLNQKQILLIEDDLIAQKMEKMMLEELLGCTVDVAGNDQEALEKVIAKNYDLILMDIGLPNVDGFVLTKKIRDLNAHYSNAPIVGLTAHIDGKAQQFEYMDEVLLKPLSDEICLKLTSLLKENPID